MSWLWSPANGVAVVVGHSMHLVFCFTPEVEEQSVLKLKIEINTREHDSRYGLQACPFLKLSRKLFSDDSIARVIAECRALI